MRTSIIILAALALGACAYHPGYNKGIFQTEANANPIERKTEFLRQIRHAEIDAEKQRSGDDKKSTCLFKQQDEKQDCKA